GCGPRGGVPGRKLRRPEGRGEGEREVSRVRPREQVAGAGGGRERYGRVAQGPQPDQDELRDLLDRRTRRPDPAAAVDELMQVVEAAGELHLGVAPAPGDAEQRAVRSTVRTASGHGFDPSGGVSKGPFYHAGR